MARTHSGSLCRGLINLLIKSQKSNPSMSSRRLLLAVDVEVKVSLKINRVFAALVLVERTGLTLQTLVDGTLLEDRAIIVEVPRKTVSK